MWSIYYTFTSFTIDATDNPLSRGCMKAEEMPQQVLTECRSAADQWANILQSKSLPETCITIILIHKSHIQGPNQRAKYKDSLRKPNHTYATRNQPTLMSNFMPQNWTPLILKHLLHFLISMSSGNRLL